MSPSLTTTSRTFSNRRRWRWASISISDNMELLRRKFSDQARQCDRAGDYARADLFTRLLEGTFSTRMASTDTGGFGYDPSKNELLYAITLPEGYVVKNERIRMRECPTVDMKSAYTKDGHYIGTPEDAEFFFRKKGLSKLQPAQPGHTVCSIGFNEKEQKWYGWSHRAMKGFGVGDTPEEWFPNKTSKGAKIKTLDEAKDAARAFAESVS